MESSVLLSNPVAAHAALMNLWPSIKGELVAGNRLVLEVHSYEDKLTDRQRRYSHGYILKEISAQASIDGRFFPISVWKEHFRKTFLGSKRKSFVDPLTGRKSKRSIRVSTEDLGVRGYNQLIERVTAFAVTDLGVRFDVAMDEWIDQETGEIHARRSGK
jgi:hypothetical protein